MKTLTTFFKHSALAVATVGLLFTTSCSEDDNDGDDNPPKSETYSYEFNNGQAAGVAYGSVDGSSNGTKHRDDFSVDLTVKEKTESSAEITVVLKNTVDGATYMIHSHDAADPATTPNGTPYNETPNADVLATMVAGNGGEVSVTYEAKKSYTELTTNYSGFFVVHDPLQTISTTDISTYLVVGSFARAQAATGLEAKTFNYTLNTGQLNAAFAYNGSHPTTITGALKIQELADGNARVSVMLDNTVAGEMYMIHSHDAADPATTPNGTPYIEAPNTNVLTTSAMGNGSSVFAGQLSTKTYAELTSSYDAFFVVHDPLQPITTTDPTTYILLGLFAK